MTATGDLSSGGGEELGAAGARAALMGTGTTARRRRALRPLPLAGALLATLVACLVGLSVGPASIPPGAIVASVASHLPLLHVRSPLDPVESAILWQVRCPRVVLGLLVGGTLALAGGGYQGVFRNPLADPYLLGVAAGAGLGATIAIVRLSHGQAATPDLVPVAAFVGALAAVAVTYLVAGVGATRGAASLLLAGVAVASLLTAVQTFLQQQSTDTLQEVYVWLLGRLSTAQWHDVVLILPYVGCSAAVVLAHGRLLDVLSVGDLEAATLGVPVARIRITVVVAASLGTAAVVAV
ncbi:MAG: FecCD family ABC transporter permease, partial [Acidimicrobiales bacterium]